MTQTDAIKIICEAFQPQVVGDKCCFPNCACKGPLESVEALKERGLLVSNAMVYCVMCIDDDGGCCVHIFSTQEKADAFAQKDDRRTVLYDYVIDHPERMEQQAS